MENNIKEVIQYLKDEKVDYGDIRIIDTIYESISTENQIVLGIGNSRNRGAGIRVIHEGSMGFASTNNMDKLVETAAKSVQIARYSKALQNEKICLAPKDVVTDTYETPVLIDPFTVPKSDKIEYLLSAERNAKTVQGVSKTSTRMYFHKQKKIYADTEGSYITQNFCETGLGMEVMCNNGKDIQIRSYPSAFGGDYRTAGYEFVLETDLPGNAKRTAEEAVMLINAEVCPEGCFDIILEHSQLALQVHESIGHPTELDRIFGSEAAYAGMSFVTVDMAKEGFKYGSEHVTIIADATIPGGLGTFGYDDDGVKAQRTVIIDKGRLTGFQTSRDTAVKLGQSSSGACKADNWHNMPIVRMTNFSLEPGDYELDELVAGIDDGLMLSTLKSWSIDDKRINFQFATEIAYEIKNGKLTGKIFKNPIYTGITPEFWGSCDGICSRKYWKVIGVPNCGKGQPGQMAHVGHGVAPARFRNVKVGVGNVK